ncbi:MAG TPA: hypothetical protein PLV53_01160 [Anaerolineaceae bacterium]|nr:hypothetical protein [Anaerolineaceae bacterium]
MLNKKHLRTLEKLFSKPDSSSIPFEDFEALCVALGAVIRKTGGSMVGIRLNGIYAVFHAPHPGRYIYVTDLKRIRRFLINAGVQPPGKEPTEL